MKKALIIYGSELGNTRAAAEIIAGVLKGRGLEVTVKDVVDADVSELGGDQDITLLGCSTWGAIEADVQRDFLPFFEDMASVVLSSRSFAIFGSGDKGWDVFCRAVNAIEARVREQGGTLVTESLKIDGNPEAVRDEVEAWALGVADKV